MRSREHSLGASTHQPSQRFALQCFCTGSLHMGWGLLPLQILAPQPPHLAVSSQVHRLHLCARAAGTVRQAVAEVQRNSATARAPSAVPGTVFSAGRRPAHQFAQFFHSSACTRPKSSTSSVRLCISAVFFWGRASARMCAEREPLNYPQPSLLELALERLSSCARLCAPLPAGIRRRERVRSFPT